jgi:hypothetical protein
VAFFPFDMLAANGQVFPMVGNWQFVRPELLLVFLLKINKNESLFICPNRSQIEKLNAHWYSVSPTIGNTMLAVRCL